METHVTLCCSKGWSFDKLVPEMMILEKKNEDKPIIVLHTHLWSAITWPLITTPGPRRSTFFSLDPQGQAEWLTVFDPNTYDVVPAVPVMSEGWLCLESSSASQPFLEYVVGHYSCDLSFFQLCAAASYLNCVTGNVKNKSRKQLLLSVAKHLAWILTILWTWTRNSLPRKASHVTSLICSWFRMSWRTWDGDERHTYKGLRDKVASHDHVQKRKQWMHWLKEKREEVKVLGCCISELCFFRCLLKQMFWIIMNQNLRLFMCHAILKGQEGESQSQSQSQDQSKGKSKRAPKGQTKVIDQEEEATIT